MKQLFTVLVLISLSNLGCRQSREINIKEGFESGKLRNIWSSRKVLPGDLVFVHDIVRSGNTAIRITLHPGDQLPEEKGTILERAEIMESPFLFSREDSIYEYSFSMYLPKDFPIVNDRLVLAQWKQYCRSGKCAIDNPVIALRYESGKLFITLKTDPEKKILYSSEKDIRGKWLDFKFLIRFSRSANGMLSAWLNDSQIVNFTGETAYSEKYGYDLPDYFYFKMGLYRDKLHLPMSIYIDDYSKKMLAGKN